MTLLILSSQTNVAMSAIRKSRHQTSPLLTASPITRSAVGGARQATVKPSCRLWMNRHIQAGDLAPGENAGHVQVGDGKAIANQILAPGQSVVEDSQWLSQQQLVAFRVRGIAGRFGQHCTM